MFYHPLHHHTARRGAPRPEGLREGLKGIGAALTSWRRRVPAAARAQVLPRHVRLRLATPPSHALQAYAAHASSPRAAPLLRRAAHGSASRAQHPHKPPPTLFRQRTWREPAALLGAAIGRDSPASTPPGTTSCARWDAGAVVAAALHRRLLRRRCTRESIRGYPPPAASATPSSGFASWPACYPNGVACSTPAFLSRASGPSLEGFVPSAALYPTSVMCHGFVLSSLPCPSPSAPSPSRRRCRTLLHDKRRRC